MKQAWATGPTPISCHERNRIFFSSNLYRNKIHIHLWEEERGTRVEEEGRPVGVPRTTLLKKRSSLETLVLVPSALHQRQSSVSHLKKNTRESNYFLKNIPNNLPRWLSKPPKWPDAPFLSYKIQHLLMFQVKQAKSGLLENPRSQMLPGIIAKKWFFHVKIDFWMVIFRCTKKKKTFRFIFFWWLVM